MVVYESFFRYSWNFVPFLFVAVVFHFTCHCLAICGWKKVKQNREKVLAVDDLQWVKLKYFMDKPSLPHPFPFIVPHPSTLTLKKTQAVKVQFICFLFLLYFFATLLYYTYFVSKLNHFCHLKNKKKRKWNIDVVFQFTYK